MYICMSLSYQSYLIQSVFVCFAICGKDVAICWPHMSSLIFIIPFIDHVVFILSIRI